MTGSNRLWVIGAVTVMLITLLAGWFIGAQPLLAAAAKSDSDRASLDAQNAAQQAQIAVLTEQNKDLPAIEADFKALQKSIPGSPNTAAFIDGLNGLAESTGVQVSSITVGETTAYTPPVAPVAPEAPTDGSTPAPEATAAPVEETGYTVASSPLITADNFVAIKVGVELKGSYDAVLSFVKGLQSGPRLVLVVGFTSTSDAVDASQVVAHVDGLLYVIKQPKQETAQ